MRSYIGGRPSFHFWQILGQKWNEKDIFPLNQERCFYYFSARYALAAGIKALGIKPGDAVLLPSYNCGAEIDPILHSKIRPVFYKIGKNLHVDCDDMVKRITENVKAILVTHFLGFPQPVDQIKQICTEKDLFLIEDCAHALLSAYGGKPLGSYGDVSIFSLLKTLPVPNGGVLLINGRNIIHNYLAEKPNLFATSFYAAELLRYKTWDDNNSIEENGLNVLYKSVYLSLSFARLMLAGFRKCFNPKGLYLVKPDSHLFVENLQPWGISGLSKRIINRTNFEEIKNIRRGNFEYLLKYFLQNERGILPFKELPSGVCPLFFPIILESAERRVTLYNTLKSRGVITHPWWDRFHPQVPWDEFPEAVYLKTKLFGLPIHQDLTLKHLEHVIEEFEKVYNSL
ncbi:MAG: DegT/DnrJ/EryC1/StrS family aminotransferase [Thermodesulfobacteriota bacterium]|jgi:dTDP-4-amino-4,6-dideoxygalactose transaminase